MSHPADCSFWYKVRSLLEAFQEAFGYALEDLAALVLNVDDRMKRILRGLLLGMLEVLVILGVAAFAGGAAGYLLGFVLSLPEGGAASIPLAVAGTAAGIDLAFLVLDVMGIAFLVKDISKRFPGVVNRGNRALALAWEAGCLRGTPARESLRREVISHAARELARSATSSLFLLLEAILVFVLFREGLPRGTRIARELKRLMKDPASWNQVAAERIGLLIANLERSWFFKTFGRDFLEALKVERTKLLPRLVNILPPEENFLPENQEGGKEEQEIQQEEDQAEKQVREEKTELDKESKQEPTPRQYGVPGHGPKVVKAVSSGKNPRFEKDSDALQQAIGPNAAKISGNPDTTVIKAADADREVYQAARFADQSQTQQVFVGQDAKSQFKIPDGEQFPDVAATNADGTVSLGEGKGSDLKHMVEQLQHGGDLIQQNTGMTVSQQEVTVPRIKILPDGTASPGPGFRVNEDNYLEEFNPNTEAWELAEPNGVPVKVVVRNPNA